MYVLVRPESVLLTLTQLDYLLHPTDAKLASHSGLHISRSVVVDVMSVQYHQAQGNMSVRPPYGIFMVM
jgi:hypothetical protein